MNKKLICIIGWMVCLIVLTIIAITGTPGKELVDRLTSVISAGIGVDIVMILCFIHQGKLRINTKVNKTNETVYYREPPFDYSPVIITYLQNLKLEFKKDMIAEIAFLINKKILILEKSNDEYYIDFYRNRKPKVTLLSQTVILTYLRFMPGKIKLEDFIKELQKYKYYIESCYEKDCVNLGYIEKGKRIEKINTKILYIIIGILLIPTILILVKTLDAFGLAATIATVFLIWIISLAYSVPFISIINAVKTRTQKAKKEYAEWLAFIDFIKDYSYLNERKLQELEIWDKYLTYSIAFGVTEINTLLKM